MPIKDVQKLNEAQDAVFANPKYQPKGDTTFCNLATQEVLRRLGYTRFDDLNVGGDNPFTADEMYAYIKSSDDWLIKPMADVQSLANEGTVLVAILPAYKLDQVHGHLNTLTTGREDFSGRWNYKTPLCMNLGGIGNCFRARGVNWAFQIPPEIYALVSTL